MIGIKNLSVELGDFYLKNISLDINDGEYFVILGPTGAGKTVLLECIAGLHRIRQGEVWLNGTNATRLTPEERNMGYVPQDCVLFPFLNVSNNIAFGLKQANYSKTDREDRVKVLAELTGISHLLARDTQNLSGGEKQRVALARALAVSPRVLLLDEPLCNLDLQTAKYLRLELKRIHKELGITTLHVTHNLDEAEEIADRIAVIHNGSVEQVATPDEVFFYPKSEAVSNFIGAPNILDCDHCRELEHGVVEANCGGLPIIIAHEGNSVDRIALLPRDIYVSDTWPPGPGVNRFRGTIKEIKVFGDSVRLEISAGTNNLVAEVPYHVFEEMNLEVGKEVFLILKLRRIRAYECKCNHGDSKETGGRNVSKQPEGFD